MGFILTFKQQVASPSKYITTSSCVSNLLSRWLRLYQMVCWFKMPTYTPVPLRPPPARVASKYLGIGTSWAAQEEASFALHAWRFSTYGAFQGSRYPLDVYQPRKSRYCAVLLSLQNPHLPTLPLCKLAMFRWCPGWFEFPYQNIDVKATSPNYVPPLTIGLYCEKDMF